MSGEQFLVALILIGILGHSKAITTAACILLVLKMSNLQSFISLVERRGIDVGLLCLMMAVLVPFVKDKFPLEESWATLSSWPGILAILGGILATHMNGKGLQLLTLDPHLIIGIVVGSVIGIIFFGGMPIGPLMAAGIIAIMLEITAFFR